MSRTANSIGLSGEAAVDFLLFVAIYIMVTKKETILIRKVLKEKRMDHGFPLSFSLY
jgi:hypothetical protein